MPQRISVDEFLSARKDFVKSGDIVTKVAKGVSSWNPDKRSARFVMSAEVEDRYKDIVVQAGIDLTEFNKNPAAPFSHDSRTFPVGNWENVEKILGGRPKRLEGDLVLMKDGEDEVADRLARHIGAGTVRACSIGFIPIEVERREVPEDKRDSYYYPGYIIHSAELLECSPCLIGANPAAIAKAIADGADAEQVREYRDMIEDVLDNWSRSPEGLLLPREEYERAYKFTVEKVAADVVEPAASGASQPGDGPMNLLAHVDKAIDSDLRTAIKELGDAIELHQKHMDGDEPPAMASQKKMMGMMERAYKALTADDSVDLDMGDDVRNLTDQAIDAFVTLSADDSVELDIGDEVRIVAKAQDGAETGELALLDTMTLKEATALRDDIVARIAAAKAAPPENKQGTEVATDKIEPVSITLKVDTSEAEAAVAKMEGIFGRLAKAFPMFFPKTVAERIEPTITPPDPPAPPTIEAISEAKAKAQAVRDRLVSKGLIAA